jgi:hypothetical protein
MLDGLLVACRFPIALGRSGGCSSAATALFGAAISTGDSGVGLMIIMVVIVSVSVEVCVRVKISVIEKDMMSLGSCVKFIFETKMFFVSRR